jgi:hypothetical protein
VVEPDSPVLTKRVAAFVVLGAAVGTWFVVARHFGAVSLWTAVAIVSAGVMPATLGLVFIALPLARLHARVLFLVTLVIALIAFGTSEAGVGLAANFAKLWAAVFAGWTFLAIFEELSWVVIVAAIIPVVDAISVFAPQGPTHQIITQHPSIYSDVSVAFLATRVQAAYLGPPDILFFALFLGAAARWKLRPGWTWIAATGMYALTTVLTAAGNFNGLPALPFLSFGFLIANADLLWRRFRPAIDAPDAHA